MSPLQLEFHRAASMSIVGVQCWLGCFHIAGVQLMSVEGSRMNLQEHQSGDLFGIKGKKEKKTTLGHSRD